MTDHVVPLLKVHEYFRGAPDEALREVAAAGRVTQHAAGEVVHEANAPVTTVGFVLRGRLKAVRVDARGVESLFRMVERGEQFGMMVGAQTEPVPIRVVALEPTAVLNLDYDAAMDLTFRHPALRRLWLATFAGSLRTHFFGAARKRAPTVLALIHESPATRAVAGRLVDRLLGLGERLAVFGDADDRRYPPDVPFRPLRVDGRDVAREDVRRQAAEWHDATRILFDLDADTAPERLSRLLEIADRAVFFVPGAAGEAAARRLLALDVPARGWRDKLAVAWLLEGTNVAPDVPPLRDLVARDFKIADPPPGHPFGRVLGPAWNGWCTTSAGCGSGWPSAAGRPAACPTSGCSSRSRSRGSWST